MKAAFFTSTGRTGTDFFTQLFNDTVENTWSLHEPKPAFKRKSYKLVSGNFNLYDKYYFYLPRLYRHKKREEEWYIETNYHLFAAIPLIKSVLPDSLIFHIVRDGRNVVTSWLNRWKYIVYFDITPFHIKNDPAQKYWKLWNPLQKLSWYWKTVNTTAMVSNPDMFIKFEDLFKDNNGMIFEILDKFDSISYDKEKVLYLMTNKVNKNKIEFFPKYDEWPQQWKDQFWEIAGKEMKNFGYV